MKKVIIVLCIVIAPPLFAANKAKVASNEQKSSDILLGGQVCKDKLLTSFAPTDDLAVDMFVAAPNAHCNGWVYGRINNIIANQVGKVYAVLVSSTQYGHIFSKEQLRKLPPTL